MNALNAKTLASQAALVAAGLALLTAFGLAASRIEVRVERALDSAVTAQDRLYADAVAPVQMPTVVIIGKRGS